MSISKFCKVSNEKIHDSDKQRLQTHVDAYASRTIAPYFNKSTTKTCMYEESFSILLPKEHI